MKSAKTDSDCYKCLTDFALITEKDICVPEIPYCITYEDDPTKCKTCKDGYVYTAPDDQTGCAL